MGEYTVTWIGPKNNFGSLDGPYTPVGTDMFNKLGISPPRGDSLRCLDTPYYNTHAGQAHLMTEVCPNGNVIVIMGSLMDNPLASTAMDCQIAFYDLSSGRVSGQNIPTELPTATVGITTSHALQVLGSNGVSGAPVCTDVLKFKRSLSSPQQITTLRDGYFYDGYMLVLTSGVYTGWDLGLNGEFPMMAFWAPATPDNYGPVGDPSDGRILTWQQYASVFAANVLASDTVKAAGIYTSKAGTNGNYIDTHLPISMDQFPQSKHVVIAHYNPAEGGTSGAFSVLDPSDGPPDGGGPSHYLKATFKIPDSSGAGLAGFGGSKFLRLSPREVICDPSSSANDERFVVVYDTYPFAGDPGSQGSITTSAPRLFQEYSYNANTKTITPKSGFINVTQDKVAADPTDATGGSPGGPCEIGTFAFATDGTLFVTTQVMNSAQPGADLAVFQKALGERKYVTLFPAASGWQSKYGANNVAPDFYVPAVGRYTPLASLNIDTQRQCIIAVGANGVLNYIGWDTGMALGQSNLVTSPNSLDSGTAPGGTPNFLPDGSTLAYFKFNNKYGLKMTSVGAGKMGAVSGPISGLETGRQYRFRCDFAADTHAAAGVKCDLVVTCLDANGHLIGTPQVGTNTVVDSKTINAGGNNPSGLMQTVETVFDCLDLTQTVNVELVVYTTGANQIHFAQNLSLLSVPFKRKAVVDLGVNKLRSSIAPAPGVSLYQ